MRGGLLLTLLLMSSLAIAQPLLKVDNTHPLIGDKLTLSLEVPDVAGKQWANADVVPADTLPTVQLLTEASMMAGANGRSTIAQWEIAIYDTGVVRIPPVPVIYSGNGAADTFYSNDVPVMVQGVADSTGLAPLKPIIYEPVKFSDYVPYILALIGVILAVVLILWWQKRPKKDREEIIIEIPKPPHEVAIARLYELEKEELWQSGKIGEYHSRLGHIVRQYLEARYDVAALESTTTEVRQMLKPHLSTDQFEDMMKMLQLEDLIKFAKAEPPVEVHGQHMEFARQFILNTKIDLETEARDV